jgi:hypothetical protein
MYLRFSIDRLPVSINKLYFARGGRKILSAEGRQFKNAFLSVGGNCPFDLLGSWQHDEYDRYVLRIWLKMNRSRLINARYGSDKRVKSPYKVVDASNMVKLVEDSISELIGINDRSNWVVITQKWESEEEGVDALFYKTTEDRMSEEDIGEAIRNLKSVYRADGDA